ncbi:hypothetical protein LSH36_576g00044, partial [Paralvinella palmiformis]
INYCQYQITPSLNTITKSKAVQQDIHIYFTFSSNLPLYTFPIISNKYSKCARNTISRSLYKEQIKTFH